MAGVKRRISTLEEREATLGEVSTLGGAMACARVRFRQNDTLIDA